MFYKGPESEQISKCRLCRPEWHTHSEQCSSSSGKVTLGKQIWFLEGEVKAVYKVDTRHPVKEPTLFCRQLGPVCCLYKVNYTLSGSDYKVLLITVKHQKEKNVVLTS